MATREQHAWNEWTAIRHPGDVSGQSWWCGKDRRAFTEQAARELPRMRNSKTALSLKPLILATMPIWH